MTQTEVLRLALEALIEVRDANIHGLTLTQDYHEAITAIKEALAQPEQKSVAMADYMALTEKYVALKAAQPNFCPRCGKRLGTNDWDIHTCTPPQRTWVGLTDEERNKLWREVVGWGDPSHDDEDLMKAIEAKLKEKNT